MAETTKKPAAKKTAAKKTPAKSAAKPAAKKTPANAKPATAKHVAAKKPAVKDVAEAIVTAAEMMETQSFAKPSLAKGKYVFATGRRKTAIANVRLFAGGDDNMVNKKQLQDYFGQAGLSNTALQPLALTGLLGDFYFSANVKGGGSNAQSEAIRHGIAQALASMNEDMKTVLKKNGFLTRDPREKERKKPGLRRARRSPQWAKR